MSIWLRAVALGLASALGAYLAAELIRAGHDHLEALGGELERRARLAQWQLRRELWLEEQVRKHGGAVIWEAIEATEAAAQGEP